MVKKKTLYYVVEPVEWSITWDGRYITREITKQFDLEATVCRDFRKLRGEIVHFGSRNVYFADSAYRQIHSSNRVVFTWFHGTEQDTILIEALPEGAQRADIVHTSCQISKNQLISWGVDSQKIVVVPLGVDTKVFSPATDEEKRKRRRLLAIPEQAILIGSFQKDGNGWGEGNDPKLIKGPDVFCDVVKKLAANYPIFVLLTGPARGYVKSRLTEAGIPFKHIFLEDYYQVADYFNLLDVYLITSRAEGGPKALLESFASGVPVISTRVGMSVDVIQEEINGLLVNIDDTSAMVESIQRILEDPELYSKIKQEGLKTVEHFSWDRIAQQYYQKLYSPFL